MIDEYSKSISCKHNFWLTRINLAELRCFIKNSLGRFMDWRPNQDFVRYIDNFQVSLGNPMGEDRLQSCSYTILDIFK